MLRFPQACGRRALALCWKLLFLEEAVRCARFSPLIGENRPYRRPPLSKAGRRVDRLRNFVSQLGFDPDHPRCAVLFTSFASHRNKNTDPCSFAIALLKQGAVALRCAHP